MSSAWKLEFAAPARKALKKLDRTVAARIVSWLEQRLAEYNDPRDFGEGLTGNWTGYWRYRVGDYRVIAEIKDRIVTVYVVEVGHRSNVYRR